MTDSICTRNLELLEILLEQLNDSKGLCYLGAFWIRYQEILSISFAEDYVVVDGYPVLTGKVSAIEFVSDSAKQELYVRLGGHDLYGQEGFDDLWCWQELLLRLPTEEIKQRFIGRTFYRDDDTYRQLDELVSQCKQHLAALTPAFS